MASLKQSSAYDLALFEDREPKMRVIKNNRPKAAKKSAPAPKLLACVLVVMLAAFMLYSQVALVELNENIKVAQRDLSTQEDEAGRLAVEMEGKMSLANVEEYATGKLGLVKVESSQIEYVDLGRENKVELVGSTSPVSSFFGSIGDKIKEYLGL